MSIIDSFHPNSKPKISAADLYEKSPVSLKTVIITFSQRVMTALLEDNLVELISKDTINSISCSYPIYRFWGTNIGIIKTTVGAPMTVGIIEEVSYVYSCQRFVIFGSCGSLDKNITAKSLIIPTAAYRDEGVSYHYMAASDYISIKNADVLQDIFTDLKLDFVVGKTWTTDAFFRETEVEIAMRKSEGCIVVEMELAACQAVTNYLGCELYCFLYTADNLDSSTWDRGLRDHLLAKDQRLQILNVALEIAKRMTKD